MESEFYRTALIRNFLAKLIADERGTLEQASYMDKTRLCSTSDDEIRGLIESTAEFILGQSLEKERVETLTRNLRNWCYNVESTHS
ncbi:hypothetical protein L3N51_01258 [Metallosphaera sp. J1]|uniref:hypothetical protein n=1 Tax=Metallosphaera javensis (ex Hofmann et al. 2022) TaxID=99938 RepID=UPI001EDDD133|nr:hypothetical protein [Metallosphaera javensis (ex Hofmann et al. 2022)]MCG3108968.1 hypothetical protein [Metallosphaera javensis (ex Hofmann et al. 2022)]